MEAEVSLRVIDVKEQATSELGRSEHLGLDLVIPFDLDIGNDVTIHAELLVKNFGGGNGTLVIKEWDAVRNYVALISEKLGYGISTLEEPLEPYDRETIIEMLSEWGWAGPMAEAPAWIVAS